MGIVCLPFGVGSCYFAVWALFTCLFWIWCRFECVLCGFGSFAAFWFWYAVRFALWWVCCDCDFGFVCVGCLAFMVWYLVVVTGFGFVTLGLGVAGFDFGFGGFGLFYCWSFRLVVLWLGLV